MRSYVCAECRDRITTADDLVTVNVGGHAYPAHRTCPTTPNPATPTRAETPTDRQESDQ